MNQSPKHLAIIMDGNGRWANKRLMPRSVGHIKGAANLKEVAKACLTRGIEWLTVFAFSTENWRRPPDEVSFLFDLFEQYLNKEVDKLHQQGARLRIIGDRSPFPLALQQKIQEAEAATAHNQKLNLTVAANYGGKWDIIQATRGWQRAHPNDTVEQLSAAALDPYLCTAGLPEPDLLIRTGGEARLSNFLIWQCAYTELYFSPEYWPDFNARSLELALEWYAERVRRFGQTDEQVRAESTQQVQ